MENKMFKSLSFFQLKGKKIHSYVVVQKKSF